MGADLLWNSTVQKLLLKVKLNNMLKILTVVLPLLIGFILDLIFGDPHNLPHPIRLIGNTISKLETFTRKIMPKHEIAAGTLLAIIVLLLSSVVPSAILILCYNLNELFGILIEGIMCYYLLAAKCLKTESFKVYEAIAERDTERARRAVSMIVGRDTDSLDDRGIIKAAVETVAENTSDGITAPIFYIMLGGATAGFFYKAANTMDSMIGYKNDKYINFGRFAAKLDDILNFIPSRITALLMILSAFILGFDGKNAWKIWRRDKLNHASPNSAQTEAVCAGALDVMLAGDAYYFGRLCKKKTIGDNLRPVENEDIRRANRIMYCTTAIMLIIALAVRCLVFGVLL